MLDKYRCLEMLAGRRTREVVVTTMSVAAPWARLSDTPLDFASVESAMGHAADFGLGLALAQPGRRVVVLNGDGSTLMCLGTLVTLAHLRPPNYTLVIVDNGTYEVTGNQPIPGQGLVDFAAMARGAGCPHVHVVATQAQFDEMLPLHLDGPGPQVMVWKTARGCEPVPRPRHYIRERARRLREALQERGAA
ncbi:MAG: thiamine pyrophosphate-dependent enzyme [Candidatus Latescibacterota bacterium]